ncbi:MAG TPA: UDP-N-acetylglucosamine 2-epimerase (non-hydrolyzing) [Methylocella sp.]|nr:UDP-N-acetylglucosamine 2-epimerase (non-hydrolyzing) [Methylocella sp.]
MKNLRSLDILCVGGARPNFVKLAPIIAALDEHPACEAVILHTGQHYDAQMSSIFFDELGIRKPDLSLDIGSASHAVQTAKIMIRVDEILDDRRPSLVLVVGDVNSTLAAALVAKKKNIPIAHVEAGLRSFDETMPEEINRIITDRLSDILYTTEAEAEFNLKREGIDPSRIVFAGNVMIDSLRNCLPRATPFEVTMRRAGASDDFMARARSGYAVTTLHRPSNVDDPATLGPLFRALAEISAKIPIIFPAHPRTQRLLAQSSISNLISRRDILILEPVGYLAMVGLMRDTRLVLTDSGGMQEETTGLGVPCLTLRTSTERPITIKQGTNTLVGVDPQAVVSAAFNTLATGGKAGRIPPLWDGKAAQRIVADIARRFQ